MKLRNPLSHRSLTAVVALLALQTRENYENLTMWPSLFYSYQQCTLLDQLDYIGLI